MNLRLSRRALVRGGLACALGACLPDRAFKHRHSVVPEPLDDGFTIASPASVGLDDGVLEAIHAELLREDRQRGALGMLVIKDDLLVWETYLHDERDRDRHHHVQSTTKSVTSLAFGLARERGHFAELDQTLGELMPEQVQGKAADKGDVSIEHLLTMRSGIDFDNDVFSLEMWVDKPKDPLQHILRKPLYAKPGETFHYRDADPQLIGYLLQRATGMREEQWVRSNLFDPLGIRDYFWEGGADGVSMAAHGLHLRMRDMGKLGQLVLNGGTFAGRRLISSEWIALSTQTKVVAGDGGTGDPSLGYGYYWWTVAGRNVFSAWGHGGQHILISPSDRLVLVKIALPDTDDFAGSSLDDFVGLVAPLLGPGSIVPAPG